MIHGFSVYWQKLKNNAGHNNTKLSYIHHKEWSLVAKHKYYAECKKWIANIKILLKINYLAFFKTFTWPCCDSSINKFGWMECKTKAEVIRSWTCGDNTDTWK